jgi:hypothetical protein
MPERGSTCFHFFPPPASSSCFRLLLQLLSDSPPFVVVVVVVVWCGVPQQRHWVESFMERRQEPPHTAIRKLSPYSDRVISLHCYALERLREELYAAIRATHVPGVQHAARAAEFWLPDDLRDRFHAAVANEPEGRFSRIIGIIAERMGMHVAQFQCVGMREGRTFDACAQTEDDPTQYLPVQIKCTQSERGLRAQGQGDCFWFSDIKRDEYSKGVLMCLVLDRWVDPNDSRLCRWLLPTTRSTRIPTTSPLEQFAAARSAAKHQKRLPMPMAR